jgi:acyl-CoA thioester hydrolase
MKTKYQFTLDFEVRDYECDLQGVVNNSVYMHYLEHARHKFLKSIGSDFAELTKKKINLVVVRAEIDYKISLISSDKFFVGLNFNKISPLKFEFEEDIYLQNRNDLDPNLDLEIPKLVLSAKIIGTAIDENGKPIRDKNILQNLF